MNKDFRTLNGEDIDYFISVNNGTDRWRRGGSFFRFNDAETALDWFSRISKSQDAVLGCHSRRFSDIDMQVITHKNGENVVAGMMQYWRRRTLPQDIIEAAHGLISACEPRFAVETTLFGDQPVLVPFSLHEPFILRSDGVYEQNSSRLLLDPRRPNDSLSAVLELFLKGDKILPLSTLPQYAQSLGHGRLPIVSAIEVYCRYPSEQTVRVAKVSASEFAHMKSDYQVHYRDWLDENSQSLAWRTLYVAGDAQPGKQTSNMAMLEEDADILRWELEEDSTKGVEVLMERIIDGRTGNGQEKERAQRLLNDLRAFDNRETALDDIQQEAKYSAWLRNHTRDKNHSRTNSCETWREI